MPNAPCPHGSLLGLGEVCEGCPYDGVKNCSDVRETIEVHGNVPRMEGE